MNTWRINTTNVKGINDNEKFDNVISWIVHNDFDLTILTETKLRPISAIFKSIKYQKNYILHWTIDPNHSKGSSVTLIIKKSTIGKHIYRHSTVKGRCITIYCKFKSKQMIIITGIYGPAIRDLEGKNTMQSIIAHIKSLTH